MNKLSIFFSIAALLLSILSFYHFSNNSKYAYVDVNKLLDGYERTVIERTKFEEKAKGLQANVDTLIADWQNELKIYEKERSTMSRKELELKQELLGNKQQQISSYQQGIQKQIQEEDQKATQTVVNDINDFVKEYGKEHGFKIIFGASGSGSIMYGNESSDLTEEILNGLNKEFTGKK